jgi:ubiquinone/menaquinone biosynthesis C-methylase UbiE
MDDAHIKAQVRQFYDQVGWQQISEGVYQNARYEDLRPVARDYIHRCHLRVNRHLKPAGKYLLDAGSGPIQYPEYLTYSQGYQYRVCLDISSVAMQEARTRIGEKGLFVVADVANLPFRKDVFDGIVSLHTLHHLQSGDQKKAYFELYRTLKPNSSMVVVNGWTDSPMMNRLQPLVRLMKNLSRWYARRRIRLEGPPDERGEQSPSPAKVKPAQPTGTFVQKRDAASLKQDLAGLKLDIRVWRSLSVVFMQAVFHAKLGGKLGLKLVYWLEERFPHFFGEKGQYPLVIIQK